MIIAAASQSSGNIQKDVANHIMGHVSNTTPGHHIRDIAEYNILQSIYEYMPQEVLIIILAGVTILIYESVKNGEKN